MQAARGIVSCASCRQRKLRCDRSEPCNNCLSRGVECRYVSAPRGRVSQRQSGNQQQLEGRLRHLEQLIGTLAAQRSGRQDSTPAGSSRDAAVPDGLVLGSSGSGDGPDASEPSEVVGEVKQGRIVESNSQMTYVSSDHWIAIQNEIAKVREYVELDSPAESDASQRMFQGGPYILEGTCDSTMEDILADIPPREITDRLVSRYFNSKEPSIAAIHAPNFQKEYKQFWLDQSNTPQPWIALLFGLLFMGTFTYVRSQHSDDLPPSFGDPLLAMDVFRRRAAECLILSQYATQPTLYTLEGLLVNVQCEFVRQPDAHLGVWVLCSVATRLAMRMGYHRDPAGYSQISPFRGEMRRRVWAMVVQLDTLTSCQLGLPSMIQAAQCDTALPGNLLSEDFDEDCVALPAPRPLTEMTPVLYMIVKARMLAVFGAIFNQVCLVWSDRYEHVMALDSRLHQSYASIPPCLRLASLEDCLTVAPDLLIKWYHLEILYHKARCLLHRHHMTKSYQNPECEYSRRACLDAAMMLLKHQADIFKEVQRGGMLFREKWFLTSLEQHDFILASMIICLELNSRPQGETAQTPKYSREQLTDAVQSSRHILGEIKTGSLEALQAFRVLSVLLDKVVLPRDVSASTDMGSEGGGLDHGGPVSSTNTLMLDTAEETQGTQPDFAPRLEEIGGMLNSPDLVDWELWETYIQESRSGMEFQG